MHKQLLAPWKFLYDNCTALEWSTQLAGALAELHACSPPIIHRDLKLDNVMLVRSTEGSVRAGGAGARGGAAKLVDLGLATHPPPQWPGLALTARSSDEEGCAPGAVPCVTVAVAAADEAAYERAASDGGVRPPTRTATPRGGAAAAADSTFAVFYALQEEGPAAAAAVYQVDVRQSQYANKLRPLTAYGPHLRQLQTQHHAALQRHLHLRSVSGGAASLASALSPRTSGLRSPSAPGGGRPASTSAIGQSRGSSGSRDSGLLGGLWAPMSASAMPYPTTFGAAVPNQSPDMFRLSETGEEEALRARASVEQQQQQPEPWQQEVPPASSGSHSTSASQLAAKTSAPTEATAAATPGSPVTLTPRGDGGGRGADGTRRTCSVSDAGAAAAHASSGPLQIQSGGGGAAAAGPASYCSDGETVLMALQAEAAAAAALPTTGTGYARSLAACTTSGLTAANTMASSLASGDCGYGCGGDSGTLVHEFRVSTCGMASVHVGGGGGAGAGGAQFQMHLPPITMSPHGAAAAAAAAGAESAVGGRRGLAAFGSLRARAVQEETQPEPLLPGPPAAPAAADGSAPGVHVVHLAGDGAATAAPDARAEYRSAGRPSGLPHSRPATAAEVQVAVDVYGFGVVLYEIWSRSVLAVSHIGTRRPDLPRIVHRCEDWPDVVVGGYRPARVEAIPEPVWALINECWDADPLRRPPMAAVVERLRAMASDPALAEAVVGLSSGKGGRKLPVAGAGGGGKLASGSGELAAAPAPVCGCTIC
ncbi:hypothetical protein GPECTOR_107g161 [Gonium pectorale]|uniref:Protein kinase domain-containing protein n=1 Tax=Gonium pectorale TaxID=33097 RepID=A0A150FZH2_GONPE|nr:hypothetical protein GPECTOR_107g161 [Gonium pectorale]|eukprot:KXZ43016.1 hypothetical protein GPECTOR_107g161 [Gonium pectorale]